MHPYLWIQEDRYKISEIMNKIHATDWNLELEMNEDSIEEVIMEYENEMVTEP